MRSWYDMQACISTPMHPLNHSLKFGRPLFAPPPPWNIIFPAPIRFRPTHHFYVVFPQPRLLSELSPFIPIPMDIEILLNFTYAKHKFLRQKYRILSHDASLVEYLSYLKPEMFNWIWLKTKRFGFNIIFPLIVHACCT